LFCPMENRVLVPFKLCFHCQSAYSWQTFLLVIVSHMPLDVSLVLDVSIAYVFVYGK